MSVPRRRSPRDDGSLTAQERRLRRAFQVLLLSCAAPAAAQASCGSGSGASGADDAGGRDGTALDAAEASAPDARDASAEAAPGSPDGGAEGSTMADTGATGPTCADGSGLGSGLACGDAAVVSAPYTHCGGTITNECYFYVDMSCPTYPLQAGCYLSASDCVTVCGADAAVFDCAYTASTCALEKQADGSFGYQLLDGGGPFTVTCGICPNVGRRPAGLRRGGKHRSTTALGRYFADVSRLEAASVVAFERMEDELRACGAPSRLVRAARRSARDEVRHARVTAGLARRHGAEPLVPRVGRARRRSLEQIARENAVEGCVRETFGAMVALWQSQHARAPRVQASLRRIARDETRHAALAWSLAAWADARLSPAARARVVRARTAAVAALLREADAAVDATLVREAGLPDRARARALVRGLRESIWSVSPGGESMRRRSP